MQFSEQFLHFWQFFPSLFLKSSSLGKVSMIMIPPELALAPTNGRDTISFTICL